MALRFSSLYLSRSVSFLPILSCKTSGLYQTCSFLRKNRFPASFTIRGNVTNPTHHHDIMNRIFCRKLMIDGSIDGSVEKMRATSLAWSLEELRVMELLIEPALVRSGAKGSSALSPYEPLRELKGETWKSLRQVFENLAGGFTKSEGCGGRSGFLERSSAIGGGSVSPLEFLRKYIRLSSKVLLTSKTIASRC